jgi:hypothetical protein
MPVFVEPKTLYIEGNASGQLKCPTCPTTSQGYPPVFGSGYLHCLDLKSILDETPQLESVQLDNRGELFLNPELLQIMEYAFKKDIPMRADGGVNLNNVREGILEGLVKYKLSKPFP